MTYVIVSVALCTFKWLYSCQRICLALHIHQQADSRSMACTILRSSRLRSGACYRAKFSLSLVPRHALGMLVLLPRHCKGHKASLLKLSDHGSPCRWYCGREGSPRPGTSFFSVVTGVPFWGAVSGNLSAKANAIVRDKDQEP